MNTTSVPQPGPRKSHMIAALALGAGLAGFLVGTSETFRPSATPQAAASTGAIDQQGGARTAPRYTEIQRGLWGANAQWNTELTDQLRGGRTAADLAALFGSTPASPDERAAALEARSAGRAYSGAPPVVPHSIDQTGVEACLACHESGFRVGDVSVPPMSHGPLANCTQCHVESSGAPPRRADFRGQAASLADSGFSGLPEPGAGSRAWPGAPPTIPHTTWMRESCNSCHGELASAGLRASHPWRRSCTQCHAPSAALDRSPVRATGLPTLR